MNELQNESLKKVHRRGLKEAGIEGEKKFGVCIGREKVNGPESRPQFSDLIDVGFKSKVLPQLIKQVEERIATDERSEAHCHCEGMILAFWTEILATHDLLWIEKAPQLISQCLVQEVLQGEALLLLHHEGDCGGVCSCSFGEHQDERQFFLIESERKSRVMMKEKESLDHKVWI